MAITIKAVYPEVFMNKWSEPVLVGIGILIGVGICGGIYYLTRPPKESTSPSYMNTYVSNTYVSLTKAEPQPPVRQQPPMPCEAICPECNKIIRGHIKENYCWIPPHEDCRYTGSDIKLLA